MLKKSNPLLQELANAINIRRWGLKLTQQELANKAEMHVNFIQRIEKGIVDPSYTSLVKLAKALEINPKMFFDCLDRSE